MTKTAQAQVMGRVLHPATWGRGPLPRQVSGLFYNNQQLGSDFHGGFFIARGAASERIPCTSKGSVVVIWNKSYIIGLLRHKESGKIRVLSMDEMRQVEAWRNTRAEAESKANEIAQAQTA